MKIKHLCVICQTWDLHQQIYLLLTLTNLTNISRPKTVCFPNFRFTYLCLQISIRRSGPSYFLAYNCHGWLTNSDRILPAVKFRILCSKFKFQNRNLNQENIFVRDLFPFRLSFTLCGGSWFHISLSSFSIFLKPPQNFEVTYSHIVSILDYSFRVKFQYFNYQKVRPRRRPGIHPAQKSLAIFNIGPLEFKI